MTHPYPQYELVANQLAEQGFNAGEYSDLNSDDPSPRKFGEGQLEPIIYERQGDVPVPVELRTPAVIHYHKAHRPFYLLSGVNVKERQLGFACRSIVIQNVGTNGFIWCPELGIYLTSGSTPQATINLPRGIEKISLEWHTAAFNTATPAAVAGQFAVLWFYDEWILPTTAASGGGSATASVPTAANAAQQNVNQNVASVTLRAANTSRKGLSIFNDTTANLYVSFSGAASTTNFKTKIAAGGYYEMAPEAIFTGQVLGIWDAAGAGAARVTEES